MTLLGIKLSFSNLLHHTKWCPSGLKNERVHPTLNTVFSMLATVPFFFAYFHLGLSPVSRKKNLCQKQYQLNPVFIICYPPKLRLHFLHYRKRKKFYRASKVLNDLKQIKLLKDICKL